jgi:subtilisin-like proprotein convertase family protein
VTWDVAGTTANGVDTPFVDIYLSSNGGGDFATLVASQVPNNGSELVTMPSTTGNQHRIMVRGHNHIFYDVSNTNFTVSSTAPSFSLSYDREPGGQNKQVCQGQEVSYAILYETLGGFSGTTTFSISGQPAGVGVVFSPSSITTSGTVIMTLSNTGSAVTGFYEMTVTGTSGSISKQVRLYLEVLNSSNDIVELATPVDFETNMNPNNVSLQWSPIATSNQFELQLATDVDFEQLVEEQSITGTSIQVTNLIGLQNYFWRVRPVGALCNMEFSEVYRFTTTTIDCNSFSSTNVPVTIPTTAATVNSTLAIPAIDNQIISSIAIDININHTWINDLIVTLISPSGTQVRLLNRPCPSSSQYQNANATFTMEGVSLSCNLVPQNAVSGLVLPFDSFSSLVGQNTQGTWTLNVQDVFDADGGSINSWSLHFCSENDNSEIPCGTLTTTWNGSFWSHGFPVNNVQANILDDIELSRDMEACSLLVGENVQMTVTSGNNLIVGNEVSIAASSGLMMQNNANLIQLSEATNTGKAQVFRSTSPLMRLDYALWSTPVLGTQTLKNFSPQTLNNRFYTYNTTTNLYNVVPNPVTTTFEVGAGYLIRMPDNHPTSPTPWIGMFEGTPFNGYLEVDLNYLGVGNGYNLVGNPYPSTINAETFLLDNASNIRGTLYFWRKTNNAAGTAYATYTLGGATTTSPTSPIPNGTIQVGQGFFVEARNQAQPKVVFNNAMRVDNNNNQFFRAHFGLPYAVNSTFEKHRFWLNLTNENGLFSQMMVGYMEGATMEEDPLLDGRFIGDSEQSLTSLIGEEAFAVQARPLPFEVADVVPLVFRSTTSGNFKISLSTVDGLFEGDQTLYLRDNLVGIEHDLKLSDYSFYSEVGIFSARFEIIYENVTLGVESPWWSNSILIATGNQQIELKSNPTDMQKIEVYDILGRKLFQQDDIQSQSFIISELTPVFQTLLVKVHLFNGQAIIKKIIF